MCVIVLLDVMKENGVPSPPPLSACAHTARAAWGCVLLKVTTVLLPSPSKMQHSVYAALESWKFYGKLCHMVCPSLSRPKNTFTLPSCRPPQTHLWCTLPATTNSLIHVHGHSSGACFPRSPAWPPLAVSSKLFIRVWLPLISKAIFLGNRSKKWQIAVQPICSNLLQVKLCQSV